VTNAPSIVDLMADSSVFGRWFDGDSWQCWRVALKAAFGLPLDSAEMPIFTAATGRTLAPSRAVTEFWVAVGRRGGKSLIASFIAVYLACFRTTRPSWPRASARRSW